MSTGQMESASAGSLVVVLGTIRSGTTWLASMLGAHPAVATNDSESWLFVGLSDLWANVHSDSGDGVGALLDLHESAAIVRRFCDRIFSTARQRARPDAAMFVEKTPGNAGLLPLLSTIYPDAAYIHIVRDGRDVSRSILRAPFGQDTADEAAAYWEAAVRGVLDQQWRLPRFREVRYEQLLADPVREVSELLRWVGLDVDAGVEARLTEQAGVEVTRFSDTSPVGAGKWRELSDDNLAKIYAEAGDLLLELGYVDRLPGG